MNTVHFVGPPAEFYSTAATVIAALDIALAVELRLTPPPPQARNPRESGGQSCLGD